MKINKPPPTNQVTKQDSIITGCAVAQALC